MKPATGPFTYSPDELGVVPFNGTGGSDTRSFVLASPTGNIFPTGATEASASVRVFGIEKIADADGVLLDPPVSVALDSPLGGVLAAAIRISPADCVIQVGSELEVNLLIANPAVDPADYGDYIVVVKAQARGAGIGVGKGVRFLLRLRAAELRDTTPPVIVFNEPSGSALLGPVFVSVGAKDPAGGDGLASVSAWISSKGNAVSALPVALVQDPVLPVAADVVSTGEGYFVPLGAEDVDAAGASLATAFTSTNRSGIGTYALTVSATDAAGNTSTETSAEFVLNYSVVITQDGAPGGDNANSTGKFKIVVTRYDAQPVCDQTVVVDLLPAAGGEPVKTHTYGTTGDVKKEAWLDPVTGDYKTSFRRGEIPAATKASYKVRVSFRDVDGNLTVQGEAGPWDF